MVMPPPELLDPRIVRHLCNWVRKQVDDQLANPDVTWNKRQELERIREEADRLQDWVKQPDRRRP